MTEAGWFPDPYGDPAVQRYFDGTLWTGHTAPTVVPASPSGPQTATSVAAPVVERSPVAPAASVGPTTGGAQPGAATVHEGQSYLRESGEQRKVGRVAGSLEMLGRPLRVRLEGRPHDRERAGRRHARDRHVRDEAADDHHAEHPQAGQHRAGLSGLGCGRARPSAQIG